MSVFVCVSVSCLFVAFSSSCVFVSLFVFKCAVDLVT